MDGDDEVYKDTETLLEEGLFRVMKDDNRFVFGPFAALSSSPNGGVEVAICHRGNIREICGPGFESYCGP